MCGRFNLIDNPDTQELMDELGVTYGRQSIPSLFNLAPTEQIPVICEEEGARALRPMRWWFTPSWAKEITNQYSMFNARAETVEKSRAFSGSFRHHRLIIPMTSFIEWRKEGNIKQPYEVAYEQGCMAAAGIWSHWTDGELVLDTCAMLTRSASPEFTPYHSRQPLLLNAEQANSWLAERSDLMLLRQLLQAALPKNMVVQALDPSVNNSRNKAQPLRAEGSEAVTIAC